MTSHAVTRGSSIVRVQGANCSLAPLTIPERNFLVTKGNWQQDVSTSLYYRLLPCLPLRQRHSDVNRYSMFIFYN